MAFLKEHDELWQLIKSIAEDEGFTLYDAELSGSKQLKVSIDRTDGEHPNIDDCSKVLKRLMVTLHAEAENYKISSDIEIDVSSPGVDRQLRRNEHFVSALGEKVKIVCDKDVVAGGVLVGELKNFDKEVLTVAALDNAASTEVVIKLSQVKRANLEFVF